MTEANPSSAKKKTRKRSRSCPSCGSHETLPIAFGYPSEEMMEEGRQGKVILGGCMISDESPKWHCAICDHEWGRMFAR